MTEAVTVKMSTEFPDYDARQKFLRLGQEIMAASEGVFAESETKAHEWLLGVGKLFYDLGRGIDIWAEGK